MKGIESAGSIKKCLINHILTSKINTLNSAGSVTSCYDSILGVFRQGLGGEMKLIVTGSAPIDPNILKELSVLFNVKIHNTYGLSETTAITSHTH